MGSFSSSTKATCFLLFVLVGSAFSQNNICPFDFFFHMGDGVFDIGNAIEVQPFGPRLPAANLPYGITTLGRATGRWCDGLTDIDIGGAVMGFNEPTPYLGGNATSNNAIIFAVARSPVLDRSFFTARGVRIPAHAAPLSTQMSWFRKHLATLCITPTDCADKLGNSIFFTGDVEANDIGLSLIQGKSIEEVRTYVPAIVQAQINAAREVIKMGTTRVIFPGSIPLGCYPYILTEFASNNTADYDDYGCLKDINDLIVYKNNVFQKAIDNVRREFPDVTIFYGDFYQAFIQILEETLEGPHKDVALQACCGTGGDYNFNRRRFCGSAEATVCSHPNQYIHWDGIHVTEDANRRLGTILQAGALDALSCTGSADSVSSVRKVVSEKKLKASA